MNPSTFLEIWILKGTHYQGHFKRAAQGTKAIICSRIAKQETTLQGTKGIGIGASKAIGLRCLYCHVCQGMKMFKKGTRYNQPQLKSEVQIRAHCLDVKVIIICYRAASNTVDEITSNLNVGLYSIMQMAHSKLKVTL